MLSLEQLGISGSGPNKSRPVFERICADLLSMDFASPSFVVNEMWRRLADAEEYNRNMAGSFFEYLIAVILSQRRITPFYMQASLAFIPNVRYDLVLYSVEHGPICLSLKTSLRERYKQADLEGIVLKNVHRRSLCYLVTLDETEAHNVNRKIANGEVMGIDQVVLASSKQFDEMIPELSKLTLQMAGTVPLIKSERCVGPAGRIEA